MDVLSILLGPAKAPEVTRIPRGVDLQRFQRSKLLD
jgi:hypothetical protein